MLSLKQQATQAAWWSTLEILARYGAQFLVMVVLARLLSPADFGLIAMLLVLISIGTLLVDSGFSSALVQRQHTTPDDETTVFIFTIGVSILTAGTLVASAPGIANFFHEPKLVDLTRVTALVLPLGAFASVPDAMLTMKLNFKARARAEVIASLCSGAVAVTLALRGFGVWSLAWQGIVSIGVRGSLLWSYSGWRPQGQFRKESFRSLFGFGSYMLLSGLLNVIALRLQSLMIGRLFDSRALGFYTMAQNTQSAPASIMAQILNRVGLPVLSMIAADREKLVGALRMSLRIAMFLFVPSMVGLAVIAHPLIELMYGPRWVASAPILSVLAIGAALWPVHVLNLAAISAQGRSDLFFRLEVIKQFAGILLIALFAYWGPLAIAWSVLISGVISVGLNTYYSKLFLAYGWYEQLTDQLPTLAMSTVVAIMSWAIIQLFLAEPLIGVLAAIAASITTYVLLAILIKSSALRELLSILKELRTAQHFSKHLSNSESEK